MRSNRPTLSPSDPEQYARAWDGYRTALRSLSGPELMLLLAETNRMLQEQATQSLTTSLSDRLSASMEALDRPVLSSPQMAPPSLSTDRGQASSPSPQPGPQELLRRRRPAAQAAGRVMLRAARERRTTF